MTLEAVRYDDGTITYPGHPIGPSGGRPVETIDLSEYEARIVTWTVSTAPPPGVRELNPIAIVEFEIDGQAVRAIGQLTTDDVRTGDRVRPIFVDELRTPGAGIREPDSQSWDGYRFEPVEDGSESS